MKKIKNKNGFTLIEVIVTIALVAILGTILFLLFTNSFSSILFSGQKVEAITKASNILDAVYSLQPIEADNNISDIESEVNNHLDSLLNSDVYSRLSAVDCNNLKDSANSNEIRFCIDNKNEDGSLMIDGFNIEVVVFYLNGNKNVSLTSFIRRSDPDKEE
ncbi:MAG: type II secretion system protein [Candidatus Woesearchaeota archaeon]